MSLDPRKCGAEVHRAGKPTGELCSKPAGHKSAHSSWWPNTEPKADKSEVKVRNYGVSVECYLCGRDTRRHLVHTRTRVELPVCGRCVGKISDRLVRS